MIFVYIPLKSLPIDKTNKVDGNLQNNNKNNKQWKHTGKWQIPAKLGKRHEQRQPVKVFKLDLEAAVTKLLRERKMF